MCSNWRVAVSILCISTVICPAVQCSAVRGVVATDNFHAGVQAGQALATALGGQGQVALLRLQAGVPSTSERERGFRQGAEQGGLSILLDTYIGDDSQS